MRTPQETPISKYLLSGGILKLQDGRLSFSHNGTIIMFPCQNRIVFDRIYTYADLLKESGTSNRIRDKHCHIQQQLFLKCKRNHFSIIPNF